MVKFFSFIDGNDLEKRVNEWINSNKELNVCSVCYQTQVITGEVWHFALIYYEARNQ